MKAALDSLKDVKANASDSKPAQDKKDAKQGTEEGAIYTLIYTLGMALPFLVLALASGLVMPYFSKIKRHMMLLKKIGGFLIVLMGILLLLGQVNVLAGIFE
ncbi:cytochrome c-type biogenesis protein CcdA [Streptococcus pneumoniae]|nr:cytochrome c-type biogenesis protein CcdA [Streptococcus pneumoniae]